MTATDRNISKEWTDYLNTHPDPRDLKSTPELAADFMARLNGSNELAATEPRRNFIATRTPDAAKVAQPVQYTINSQGVILSAIFTASDTEDAARIGRFVADHNAARKQDLGNSPLAPLPERSR